MRYLGTLVTAIALVLAACDGAGPSEPSVVPEHPSMSRAQGACTNLSGTVSARFVEGEDWHVEGDLFDGEGVRIGDAFAWIDELIPHGNGAIGIRMRHRYLLDGSAISTEDSGVLTPKALPVYGFNNRLEVVGGTNTFAGATGFLRSHGEVDFGTDQIELMYHGRICV